MDFIIGGRNQGKLAYGMKQYGITEDEIFYAEDADIDGVTGKRCLYGFHLLVKRILSDQRDLAGTLQDIFAKNTFQVIISDEIGYGLVPVDAFEREYRETVGRCCCKIAGEAEHVIRVVCGIPQEIKG
ncbi:MAG: bifunctional adenosylcobinamide kinase/adenosylcobinamide-phosphate guanylyltransferase [Lachnospiraceae bacterium]|nr:bifunctional adenosylcobinamide kinase/adenosylcobinamide-phosphate guanylyltransferase [Lachnospiraceae bacterium]